MTLKELAQTIGAEALLTEGALSHLVSIEDAKNSYGTLRFLVAPIGGQGSAWVNADRVKVVRK